MNLRSLLIPVALVVPAMAQTAPAAPAPTKVAIIQFQGAVLTTQEGQQAQAALKAKFDPLKRELEKRQADLQAMQDKLQEGGATLSAEARARLERDIASGTRSLNNAGEDLNNDVQEQENRVMQSMAGKMGALIRDYATKNGYAVVIDVSSQQSSVLWASPAVNITADIVKLYDQAHPVKPGATSEASAPAPKPAPPKTATPKKQ